MGLADGIAWEKEHGLTMNTPFDDTPAYMSQRYANRVYTADTAEAYAEETALPLEVVKAMDVLSDYFVALDLSQDTTIVDSW